MLRHRIARGRLSIDQARAEVQELVAAGGLSPTEGDAVLQRLG